MSVPLNKMGRLYFFIKLKKVQQIKVMEFMLRKLAELPEEVITRANEILSSLERTDDNK